MSHKTRYEAWTSLKTSVGHVKVFGSLCFSHVPKQLRRKLKGISHVMTFIIYHSTGSYKLYSPNKNKLVIAR